MNFRVTNFRGGVCWQSQKGKPSLVSLQISVQFGSAGSVSLPSETLMNSRVTNFRGGVCWQSQKGKPSLVSLQIFVQFGSSGFKLSLSSIVLMISLWSGGSGRLQSQIQGKQPWVCLQTSSQPISSQQSSFGSQGTGSSGGVTVGV